MWASPAQAAHEWGYGHWWKQDAYSIVIPTMYDRKNTVRNGFYFANDAADFWWSVSGFRYGPNDLHSGGNPWDCSPVAWSVVICTGDPGSGGDASTQRWNISLQDAHTQACVVRLKPNWNPSFTRLQAVVRHEFGHCGGLGHQPSYTYTVMAPSAPSIDANQHDIDGIRGMYAYNHYHG